MVKEYTHRFKCWTTAIDKTPKIALEFDEDGIPHNLYEFSLWIQERWLEWRKLNGFKKDDVMWDEHHNQFDVWLGQKVGLETNV